MKKEKVVIYSKKFPEGRNYGPYSLPGIRVSDLRETGIWMTGKGYSDDPPSLYPLPDWLMKELHAFAAQWGRGKDRKLFNVQPRQFEILTKRYAQFAHVEDWKYIGPHRLRAYYATDARDKGYTAFEIRDLMRHKNVKTTNDYVGVITPQQRARINSSIAPEMS